MIKSIIVLLALSPLLACMPDAMGSHGMEASTHMEEETMMEEGTEMMMEGG